VTFRTKCLYIFTANEDVISCFFHLEHIRCTFGRISQNTSVIFCLSSFHRYTVLHV